MALGGSPLRLFRLTAGGRRVVEAVESGRALPAGHEPLTDRLLDAGAINPDVRFEREAGEHVDVDIDVVIPARNEDPVALSRLVGELRRSRRVHRVVIVDDGSAVPLGSIPGADVIRHAVNLGPAAARNSGVRATSSPYLLFVDADVTFDASPEDGGGDRPGERRDPVGVVDVLRAHFDDDRVALVAPRVRARPGPGVLAAFESVRSPLDLGREPSRVRASTRVSYVPAATVMMRRDVFLRLGGFDDVLRFGEDVDLVWRLDDAGWRCRYEPAAVVQHAVRPTLRRWLRQRRDYGTSAAPLARRHGTAVAPMRMSRWSLAAWAVGAVARPVIGVGIAASTTIMFARRLHDVPGRTEIALRYAGLGHLHAGQLIARLLTRAWWPLSLVAALVSSRARRVLAVAVVAPIAVDWLTRRPRLDPLRFAVLSLADDVAYGTGVWIGCWRERDLTALAPTITR